MSAAPRATNPVAHHNAPELKPDTTCPTDDSNAPEGIWRVFGRAVWSSTVAAIFDQRRLPTPYF